jgi:3-phenylpropionate/trans-cinnamate dioxygenase ferredoxin subunit
VIFELADGWVKVASSSEIPPGMMKSYQVEGKDILIANVNGTYYSIDNRCTHIGGPLARGKLEGYVVQCPLHGSQFDVRTGSVIRSPARTPEPRHEVKVEGSEVLVKV